MYDFEINVIICVLELICKNSSFYIIQYLKREITQCNSQNLKFYAIYCIVTEMMEETEYLKNLRNALLEKMENDDLTLTEMSIKCNISNRRLSDIISGKAKDIYLSTLVKICKNAHISYISILEINCSEISDEILKEFTLTNGTMQYALKNIKNK